MAERTEGATKIGMGSGQERVKTIHASSSFPPTPVPGDPAFLHNLVLFGRLLRHLGIGVTAAQLADVARGLTLVDLRSREDMKAVMRSLLVSRREHIPLFDRAFDLFWRRHRDFPLVMVTAEERGEEGEEAWEILRREGAKGSVEIPPDENPLPDRVYTFSAREALRQKDFAELTEEELQELKHFMKEMTWTPEARRTRRRVRASRGPYIDVRGSFRRNLRHGAEPLVLVRKQRKEKPRPIVALCDISGSMERYSRVLLQFLYAMTHRFDMVEVFVFSTRLTRITRELRRQDVDTALREAARAARDWGGGTRIGEALKTFNYLWARRVLGRGAIVLIISDGWDRGDIDLLEREIARLQRSSYRLIWLNPLLGMPGYEPLTRGLMAALPFVDDFLPIHNLASLENLATVLERLRHPRPVQRHPQD